MIKDRVGTKCYELGYLIGANSDNKMSNNLLINNQQPYY